MNAASKQPASRTGAAKGAGRAEAGRSFRAPCAVYARQPLKTWQKRALSMAAREAFEKLRKYGAIEQPDGVSVSAWFESWKHAEQGRALAVAGEGGPVSLNDCKQAHYRTLEIHFTSLSGRTTAQTFERAMESEETDEGRRQARHHLSEEIRRINEELGEEIITAAYVATICRAQFKCEPSQATPEQVINLLATVRRRGAAKIAKQQTNARKTEG